MFQHFPRFSLHRLSIDSTCSHYNMEVFPYFLASKLAFCQAVPGTARRLDDRRRLADIKKLAMGSSFKNPTKASYFYVFICHICSDLFIDVHICSYLFICVHICSYLFEFMHIYSNLFILVHILFHSYLPINTCIKYIYIQYADMTNHKLRTEGFFCFLDVEGQ